MAQIIDGKRISFEIKEELRRQTDKLKERGIVPGLAVILVGEDPASQTYVRNKTLCCEQLGYYSRQYVLPESVSQDDLIGLIDELNSDAQIHGILVQLPLPRHLDKQAVIHRILPEKDVDAFHPVNVGRIMTGDFDFLPCTPAGVIELIERCGIDVEGKHCVVIGRSDIVGKPQAMLMLHKNATVTICHSKTADLPSVTRQADILVAAVGRAGFVTADMVKSGAVVIDVGINRNEQGKLCGDVVFDDVSKVASYITPVPGGVGPMTIAMLMKNTMTAALRANGIVKE